MTNTLADLIPDERNANKGSERGTGMLEHSLRSYGAGRSILLDKNNRIIAGNKTTEAAASIGLDKVQIVDADGDTIIAVRRTDLDLETDSKAKELALADNRISEISLDWDAEVLKGLDAEIDLSPFFSEKELEDLIGKSGFAEEAPEAQLDKADELREKWQTAKGQIWEIPAQRGPHRLLCGDSTSQADVSRLMGDVRARMAFTDPPWNVGIGQDSNPRHRQREGLQNDKMLSDDFCHFLRGFAKEMARVVEGDVYCILGASEWPNLDRELRGVGYHWSATIIWVKDLFVLGRSKYHRRYEPIWYGWHEKGKSSFGSARDLDDVWEIARPRVSEEHPTMKPVDLPRRAIENSSGIGEIVYEPFSGGGQKNRSCAMAKRQEVFVIRHENGWAVSKPHAERASAVRPTQAEAIDRAREISDGGTIHIQGRDGRFRTETPFD